MPGTTDIMSSIGSGLTDLFKDFDLGSILKSDQLWKGLDAGAGLWGAYNSEQAMDKTFALADKNMAMTEDAFNRDKEAEERRQSLNFG